MELFQLSNDNVTFSPQALALKPFKALWDRDKSKGKTRAIAELSLLYFLVDYRSDFSNYVNEEDRYGEIMKVINIGSNWKPDKKFEEAKALYIELQRTPALEMLNSLRIGMDKVNTYCKTVDLNERDEKNKPIHNPRVIQGMAKEAAATLKSIDDVEEKVKKQIDDKAEFKGANKPGLFEDGM